MQTYRTSQCVAPVHIAVKLWREKDVGKELYESLMAGLPPRLQIETLTAHAKKCRSALVVATTTKNRDKRVMMVETIGFALGAARKETDGQWRFRLSSQLWQFVFNEISN